MQSRMIYSICLATFGMGFLQGAFGETCQGEETCEETHLLQVRRDQQGADLNLMSQLPEELPRWARRGLACLTAGRCTGRLHECQPSDRDPDCVTVKIDTRVEQIEYVEAGQYQDAQRRVRLRTGPKHHYSRCDFRPRGLEAPRDVDPICNLKSDLFNSMEEETELVAALDSEAVESAAGLWMTSVVEGLEGAFGAVVAALDLAMTLEIMNKLQAIQAQVAEIVNILKQDQLRVLKTSADDFSAHIDDMKQQQKFINSPVDEVYEGLAEYTLNASSEVNQWLSTLSPGDANNWWKLILQYDRDKAKGFDNSISKAAEEIVLGGQRVKSTPDLFADYSDFFRSLKNFGSDLNDVRGMSFFYANANYMYQQMVEAIKIKKASTILWLRMTGRAEGSFGPLSDFDQCSGTPKEDTIQGVSHFMDAALLCAHTIYNTVFMDVGNQKLGVSQVTYCNTGSDDLDDKEAGHGFYFGVDGWLNSGEVSCTGSFKKPGSCQVCEIKKFTQDVGLYIKVPNGFTSYWVPQVKAKAQSWEQRYAYLDLYCKDHNFYGCDTVDGSASFSFYPDVQTVLPESFVPYKDCSAGLSDEGMVGAKIVGSEKECVESDGGCFSVVGTGVSQLRSCRYPQQMLNSLAQCFQAVDDQDRKPCSAVGWKYDEAKPLKSQGDCLSAGCCWAWPKTPNNPYNAPYCYDQANVFWTLGYPRERSCSAVCARFNRTCSERRLTLLDLPTAKSVDKVLGGFCTSWNEDNYRQGFSQCIKKEDCVGSFQLACSFPPARVGCEMTEMSAPSYDFDNGGQARFCPCI